MFRETNLNAATSSAAHDGVLRHPDGGIDFDTYRKRARQQRNAAIQSLMTDAGVRLSRFIAGLAGKSGSINAGHRPHHAR